MEFLSYFLEELRFGSYCEPCRDLLCKAASICLVPHSQRPKLRIEVIRAMFQGDGELREAVQSRSKSFPGDAIFAPRQRRCLYSSFSVKTISFRLRSSN